MSRIGIAAASLAAWYVLFARGGAALAAGSPNPISVEQCRINNSRSYVSAYRPLVVAFTNRAPVAADEVRFTIEYAGRTEHIVDKGTFAQNVRIDHSFDGFYNVPYRGPAANCTVDYVRFRDGTVWTAAASSPMPTCGSL
jgi:hypothetical protein